MNRKGHQHLNLLCDIGELAALLAGSENIKNFLQRTVEMVARHMNANGCSIYLLDGKQNELVLRASVGLKPESIGKMHYKIGEGVIGSAFNKPAPNQDGTADHRHSLMNFGDVDYDSADSLLTVPVRRGVEKIGVLTVPHPERDYFDEIDALWPCALSHRNWLVPSVTPVC